MHAYLGTTTRRAVQHDAVLDTGAASSFIRADLLPVGARLKPIRDAPNVRGANSQPLAIKGTVDLMVQVGNCKDHVVFYVAPSLAAPVILGCDFCDRHVEAIQPRRRVVEMDDGSTIPILRTKSSRRLDEVDLIEDDPLTERRDRSPRVQVRRAMRLEPCT